MKKSSFLLMAASMLLVTVGAVSCSDNDKDPVDPSIDKSLSVAPNSVTFPATAPTAQELTVTTDADSWTIGSTASWYTAVKSQTEDNKIVVTATGDNTGAEQLHTLVISAPGAADFEVTVKQSGTTGNGGGNENVHSSLQGSEYIIFQIDEYSREDITGTIIADYSPDGIAEATNWEDTGGNQLMVWEALVGGSGTGLSFYGYSVGWVCFTVEGAQTWSGGSYNSGGGYDHSLLDFSMIDDDWYFHLAVKGTPTATYEVGLDCGSSVEYNFRIGAGTQYDLSMSGWTEIEIPFSDILDTGWEARDLGNASANTFFFLCGANNGDEIQWDAVFFYKK